MRLHGHVLDDAATDADLSLVDLAVDLVDAVAQRARLAARLKRVDDHAIDLFGVDQHFREVAEDLLEKIAALPEIDDAAEHATNLRVSASAK